MNDDLLGKFDKVESYHWWWEGRRRLVGDFVEQIGKKGKLLDVGCGTGGTLAFLGEKYKGWTMAGVDASAEAVRYAKTRSRGKIFLAKAEKMPFGNNEFDAVLLLDVVEHFKNPAKELTEVKRVLKPGGKILITCPALKLIWSRHDEGQGHMMRYERKEMRQLAKECGMNLLEVKYFNFVMSLPIIVVRMLGKLPGFGFLVSYDNGINYELATVGPLNRALRLIFVAEVAMLSKVTYPWGISLMAVMSKPEVTRSSANSKNKGKR